MINKKLNHSIVNIAVNRKAKHKYFIEDTLEAGLVLLGWEVKAFKSGHVNISDSYISFNLGEVYLIGSQFSALHTTNLHTLRNFSRHRKVLLNKNENVFLYNKVYKSGYTAIVLSFFLKNNWCKMNIAVAKGKTQFEKREAEKKSQWKLEKNRIMKKQINRCN
ncbi:MAG: SsrA-binding protein SmpB [Buchnera aphidicola (Floraphis choui)]